MNSEKSGVSADLMKSYGKATEQLKFVVPAVHIVLLLLCKEFMQDEMDKLSFSLEMEAEKLYEDSPEIKRCRAQKAEYDRALANLENIDIKGNLPAIITLFKASPTVLTDAAAYLQEHSEEIVRILESIQRNGN